MSPTYPAACIVVLALLAAVPPLAAQSPVPSPPTEATTHREIIRGKVTTDSGTAIVDAAVTVTMAPDRLSASMTTDSSGRYKVLFERGTGDYLVHVAASGFRTFRKRVARTDGDSVIVVDAQLHEAAPQALAPVAVRERRTMPPRDNGVSSGAGAAEDGASGLSGAVPPDVASAFAALASTVPGIAATNGGISALGLGAEQTLITMNGMSFPGADLPRAVEPTVRVATSSFDPARGWFGGAQVDAGLGIGPRFSRRSGYLTLDVPALQYTDPVSSRLGARPFRLQGSLGGSGPLDDDRYWYNYGLEGGRSITDASTLLDLDSELLQLAGVSADSAAKLLDLLGAAGIPTSAPEASSFASYNASVFATVSRAPYDWKTLTPSKSTAQLSAYGKLLGAQQVMADPSLLTATPAHGRRTGVAVGNVQGLYSSYFGPHDWLNTSRSAFSISTSRSDPFLHLPSGQVLLISGFPDGSGGVSSLAFGGNGALDERTTRWTWETVNETKFYARGKPAHLVKLTMDARLDGYTQERAANRLGTFSFNSLDALANARPSSFTRTLALPEVRGGEWNSFIALGDQWRVSPKLQLQYGARLEGNVFTSAPSYNPEIDRILGRRTDHAPNTIHVSPRVGFTWITGSPDETVMSARPLFRWTERLRARWHRRIPQHDRPDAPLECHRADRAPGERAATHLHRAGGTESGLARVRGSSQHSDELRGHGVHDLAIRGHGAERAALQPFVHGAAELAREPRLLVELQVAGLQRRGNLLAQSRPTRLRGSQLRWRAALRASR